MALVRTRLLIHVQSGTLLTLPTSTAIGGVGKSTLAKALQHYLLAEGVFSRSAMLKLEFTSGEAVSMSEADALQLLKGAVKDLTGSACDEADAREAFRSAAKLPGVLLVVDNVHSESQVGLLLQGILDTGAVVIFTSRSKVPLGGGAYDTWDQVCFIKYFAMLQQCVLRR